MGGILLTSRNRSCPRKRRWLGVEGWAGQARTEPRGATLDDLAAPISLDCVPPEFVATLSRRERSALPKVRRTAKR
jgi:hypothetical protein